MGTNPNKERLNKIFEIKRILYNCKGEGRSGSLNEEKFIAEFSLEFGTARRKVLEYLKELEMSGYITRKGSGEHKLIFPTPFLVKQMAVNEADSILGAKPVSSAEDVFKFSSGDIKNGKD